MRSSVYVEKQRGKENVCGYSEEELAEMPLYKQVQLVMRHMQVQKFNKITTVCFAGSPTGGANVLSTAQITAGLTGWCGGNFAQGQSSFFLGSYPTVINTVTRNSPLTNEYYAEKMITKINIQPVFSNFDEEHPERAVNVIWGFRCVVVRPKGDTKLLTGANPANINLKFEAGQPLTYLQQFTPTFLTNFEIIEDKIHKCFNYTVLDNTSEVTDGATLVRSANTNEPMNVNFEITTEINAKLV